jgi:hypothetical protein
LHHTLASSSWLMRRFQYLQRPTPSDFSPNVSHASHRGDEHVARSSRRRLKLRYKPASRRRFDSVTTPTDVLLQLVLLMVFTLIGRPPRGRPMMPDLLTVAVPSAERGAAIIPCVQNQLIGFRRRAFDRELTATGTELSKAMGDYFRRSEAALTSFMEKVSARGTNCAASAASPR